MFNWILPLDNAITLSMGAVQTPALTGVLQWFTTIGTSGILWITIGLVLLFFPKTRPIALVMGASLLLATILGNGVFKPIFQRPRPFQELTQLTLLIDPPSGFSFPSGHTISAFGAAMTFWFFDHRLAAPATVAAALIGFSRIYLCCHYFSDVLAGAVIGTAVAVLLCLIYRCTPLQKRFPLQPR